MADTEPMSLPPDENQGPMVLATVMPLYALAVIVYGIRIWSRLSPKFAMTAPDYIITIAMIVKTMCIAFMIVAIHLGFGRHNAYIPKERSRAIQSTLLGVFMTGVAASGISRMSIATLLLRFTTNRGWRSVVWTIIVLQATSVLAYEIVQLVQCRAVIAGTVIMRNTQCLRKTQVWAFTFVNIGICMLSDLICTALPIFVVWRLSRSIVEKSLVVILIATSLLSTACGIPKIYYLATYDFGGNDGLWDLVPEFMWCRLEEAIIIISACAPLLKGPIERLLHRLGFPTFDGRPRDIGRISTAVFGSKAEGAWPDEGVRPWRLPSDIEGTSRSMTTAEMSMEHVELR